jgi:hypothetical protein
MSWAAAGLPLVLVWLANGRVLWSDAPWEPPRWMSTPSGLEFSPSWRHRSAVAFQGFVYWWALGLHHQLLLFVVAKAVARRLGAGGRPSAGPAQPSGLGLGAALGSLALGGFPMASPAIFLLQALSRRAAAAQRLHCRPCNLKLCSPRPPPPLIKTSWQPARGPNLLCYKDWLCLPL